MLKEERHAYILRQLEAKGVVRVSDLATTLNIDHVTVRRDLAVLETAGQLHRVHGGAVPRESKSSKSQTSNLEGRIAGAATRFIHDHNVLFLGPGALVQEVVPFLVERSHLTIITNALNIAWRVAGQHRHTLHLIGGQVGDDYGIYGDPEALCGVRADWIILEASGLDAERGLTHDHRDHASMARALMVLTALVMVLIAPDRLGHAGALFVAPAGDIDVLITGREASTAPLWDLSELGIRVVLT